ncbi:hypothetical protein B7C42_07009 [Nocardia cerradoensis]|uniref:Histidine phosphatase family protein n=1 Tax=Nocardia cerradoensis TaxID=85688 RepID=A0A231GW82_9NOCA|nr:histidine phosphatase family protein [Nocardia cerradoensis]OXR40874.1 hypothetical protein B7C42_07009 [Nocardia cerradoensis]
MNSTRSRWIRAAAVVIAGVVAFALHPVVNGAVAHAAPPDRSPVVVYIVEHGEPVVTDPALPLSDNGVRWGRAVSAVLHDVAFTNVYASSALRSKQTVSFTADSHGLPVVQLPNSDPRTPSADAAEPIARAVSALPPGSVALVGGNTENIYRIMNALGIPVVPGCGEGQRCVPCLDKTCFTPTALSTIWQLTLYGSLPPGVSPETGLQRIRPETANVMNLPNPSGS